MSGDRVAPDAVVVAVDGPSGVGKSTVARLVARQLGLSYLDTGALYRAMAVRVLDAGVDPADDEAVAALVAATEIEIATSAEQGTRVRVDGEDVSDRLRLPEVSRMASRVARKPSVRAKLTTLQRRTVAPPGAVVEGRDIGTVVFPRTPFKFFLDARAEVRARRRLVELRRDRPEVSFDEVLAEIEGRDRRDRERETSPLRADEGYVVVDTSDADAETIAAGIVRAVRGAHAPAEP